MSKGFPTESSPSPFENEDGLHYKVVRLKTGEAILCMMADDVNSLASVSHLILVHPVQATASNQIAKDNSIFGETFQLRPWVGLSNSREFVIGTDIVLTIGNLKPQVIRQYLNYLEDTDRAEKFFAKQRAEEEKRIDEATMEVAIFELLTQVNEGRQVYIVKDEY